MYIELNSNPTGIWVQDVFLSQEQNVASVTCVSVTQCVTQAFAGNNCSSHFNHIKFPLKCSNCHLERIEKYDKNVIIYDFQQHLKYVFFCVLCWLRMKNVFKPVSESFHGIKYPSLKHSIYLPFSLVNIFLNQKVFLKFGSFYTISDKCVEDPLFVTKTLRNSLELKSDLAS